MKTFLNILGGIAILAVIMFIMGAMVSCTCDMAGTSTVVVGGQTHRCR